MSLRRQGNANTESVDNYLKGILVLSGPEERSKRHEDRALFHGELDARGPRRLLQSGIRHDYRGWPKLQPPQQALALLAARREDYFQSLPLAFDGNAVRQLQIHRLEIG